MIEFLAVMLTWITKWYKSGKTNRARLTGFCLSVVVSVIWVGFFIWHEQYWLSLNSVITICMAVRGIKNNVKRQANER